VKGCPKKGTCFRIGKETIGEFMTTGLKRDEKNEFAVMEADG